MGVDSKLYINAKYGVGEIKTLLAEGFGHKILRVDLQVDHAFLDVEHRGQTSRLLVCRSSNYGFDATLISTGSREPNHALLQEIAEVVGGMYQEADSNDNFKGFQDRHEENSRFVFEHQILATACKGIEADKFCDAVAQATGYRRKGY